MSLERVFGFKVDGSIGFLKPRPILRGQYLQGFMQTYYQTRRIYW